MTTATEEQPSADEVVAAANKILAQANKPKFLSEAEIEAALVTRVFKDERGGERPFKVLVIDSPEKWLPSETVVATYDMPILGTNRFKRFKFTGISLAAWDDLESAHVIPIWQGDGLPNEAFNIEKEKVSREKMVHVLEVSLGEKIPGSTWAEKATWLEKMNMGEFQALYMAAQYEGCNLSDGNLLGDYITLSSMNRQVEEFTGFGKMDDASKSQYFFRQQRPGDNYIIEFPLRGISAKQREEIDNECKEPEPPKIPKRDHARGGALDFKNMIPNLQDKQWLDRCRVVGRRRTMMYFNACLPFAIPGTTIQEQFDWLGGKVVGDIVKLKRFMTEEITSYASRYNSF